MSRGGRREGAGRKKGVRDPVKARLNANIEEMARGYSSEALATLYEIMRSKQAPAAARVACANSIIDRGHGRPLQTVNSTVTTKHDAADWTRDELVAFLNDAPKSGNGAAAPEYRNDEPDSVH